MNIWNVFAPVYEFSMRSQKNIYDYLYERIGEVAKDKVVLELATGPGMIARHIAPAAKSVVATDFAPKMIETALKAKNPENLSFEVADATSLRFEDNSFDVVVIANALHIIPNPEKALEEIRRVLKDGGLLIAPFFIYRLTRFTECFILPMIKFSSSEDSVSVVSKSGITMFVRISPKCCIFECFSSLSPSLCNSTSSLLSSRTAAKVSMMAKVVLIAVLLFKIVASI